MTDEQYLDHIKKIVGDFINSVVIIDDQPTYSPIETGVKIAKTPIPGVPVESPQQTIRADIPPPKKESINHTLDAKRVVDSFSNKGIICSIIRPGFSTGKFENISPNTLKIADVIILDWLLYDKDGKNCTSIIESILESDKDNMRIRLIVIFTAETGHAKILDTINKKIKFQKDPDDLSLMKNGCRIVIYGKTIRDNEKSGRKRKSIKKDRLASLDNLPDITINEFAKLAPGLLQSVAIKSITALRNSTHGLLNELEPLDPSFLAHRILIENPDDSMEYVSDVISYELKSLLERNNVGNSIDNQTIKKWYLNKFPSRKKIKTQYKGTLSDCEFDSHIIIPLLDKGINENTTFFGYHQGEVKEKNIYSKNNFHTFSKMATQIFCDEGTDYCLIDGKFSIFTQFHTYLNKYGVDYSSFSPSLDFGTIGYTIEKKTDSNLKNRSVHGEGDEISKHYWLCIQPPCDCVVRDGRKERFFHFLSIKQVENDKPFNIILPTDGTDFVKGMISEKGYDANMLEFDVDSNSKKVISRKDENDKIFFKIGKSNSKRRFYWIGNLKKEICQKIVNNHAYQISRIGLDEFEILRRSGKK